MRSQLLKPTTQVPFHRWFIVVGVVNFRGKPTCLQPFPTFITSTSTTAPFLPPNPLPKYLFIGRLLEIAISEPSAATALAIFGQVINRGTGRFRWDTRLIWTMKRDTIMRWFHWPHDLEDRSNEGVTIVKRLGGSGGGNIWANRWRISGGFVGSTYWQYYPVNCCVKDVFVRCCVDSVCIKDCDSLE